MRSLTNAISSIIVLLLVFNSYGQGKKKYLRKNKKPDSFIYGDSLIYARGIYNDSSRFFIGNSDGSMFYVNFSKWKSQMIFNVPDFTEMRDIERSGNYIIAIQSGANGKILRLQTNGTNEIISIPEWKGVFIDGIDFIGNTGFMMGDPVDSTFSLFHTFDSGKTWERCKGEVKPIKGEAGFAASGTNVQMLNDSTYVFISGGLQSRFFKSTDNGQTWSDNVLPYYPGESTGGYSMCFSDDSTGVIVGGDYADPDIRLNTTFYTTDGGDSWINSTVNPRGYRSCVYYNEGVFYACGRNGIDYSINNGEDWLPFANGTFFSMSSWNDKLIATTRYGKIILFDLIEDKDKGN